MRTRTMSCGSILSALALALLLAACGQVPASVTVDPPSASFSKAGDKLTLEARVLDGKAQEIKAPHVVWKSSDPKVVEVDAQGNVTAKKSGKAVIIAQAGTIKEEIPVNVAIYSAVKPSKTELSLTTGDEAGLTAELLDESGKPIAGEVSWKSADEAVATVDAKGQVKAVSPGATTLTAAAGEVKAAVAVNVKAPQPSSLKAAADAVELEVGGSQQVAVQALDAKGETMEGISLTWACSDPEKATVGADGTITAVGAGEALITASEPGGQSTQIKVVVR